MNWTAIVAAVVSVGGAASMIAGQPALAAIIQDPHTATVLTGLVTLVSSGVSAVTMPVHKPVATAPK